MRLLHIQRYAKGNYPLNISLCEFLGEDVPPYMILSHRWREGEILFADMMRLDRNQVRAKKGYAKLEKSCEIALQMDLEYAWIDTCCIDKTSSAELSEAINSMYNYYALSKICIAYLDDVDDHPEDESFLNDSTWFTRGWTLQELIAPVELNFYSRGWVLLGSKASLLRHASIASGIPERILEHAYSVNHASVSAKMSWAAKRTTTRAEDEAYSLMGLFGVNMPTLYGEGRRKAFRRLQLEILRTTNDHTIFAWDFDDVTVPGGMLAPTISNFAQGTDYQSFNYDSNHFPGVKLHDFKPDFNMTNVGMHISLLMCAIPYQVDDMYFAVLASTTASNRLVAMSLYREPNVFFPTFRRTMFGGRTLHHFEIPRDNWSQLSHLSLKTVWISERMSLKSWYINRPLCFRLRVKSWMGPSAVRWRKQCLHMSHPSHNDPELNGHPPPCEHSPWEVCITDQLESGSNSHEVVALKCEPNFDIAFGVLGRCIWFHTTNMVYAHSSHFHEPQYYSFPMGAFWALERIDKLVCLRYGSTHTAETNLVNSHCSFRVSLNRTESGDLLDIQIEQKPLDYTQSLAMTRPRRITAKRGKILPLIDWIRSS